MGGIIAILFLASLIVIGGIYVAIYENAPLWERFQILGVGFGMYIGILLRIIA